MKPSSDRTVAKIVAAWQKRQQAVRNVMATVDVRITTDPERAKASRNSEPSAKDAKLNVSYSKTLGVILDFAKGRFRYECKGQIYNRSRKQLAPLEITSVYAGGEGRTYYFRPESPYGKVHTGQIGGRRGFFDMDLGCTLIGPLLLNAGRSRIPEPAPDEETLRRLRIVDGQQNRASSILKCVGPDEGFFGAPGGGLLYVDEARDYLIVRKIDTMGGFKGELSMEYGSNTEHGPLPVRATYVMMMNGVVDQISTMTYRDVRINVELDDSHFDLQFPEGTEIENLMKRGPPLVAGDRGELVPSVTIARGSDSQRGHSTRAWIIGVNVVVAVLLAVMLVLRAR